MRKRLTSAWGVVDKSPKYGKYNQDRLLGIDNGSNRKRGLNKPCPVCGEYNFIPFRRPIFSKVLNDVTIDGTHEVIKASDIQGLKVISPINWIECSKCKVSYGLE